MASLLLSFADSAIGAAFGPAGAIVGRAVGALAGGVVDRALFGDSARKSVEGPRLRDLDVMGSTEGAPLPRVYGRARLSGQVIWATRLEEHVPAARRRGPIPISRISRSGCAKDRSPASAASGLTARRSISKTITCACIAAARISFVGAV